MAQIHNNSFARDGWGVGGEGGEFLLLIGTNKYSVLILVDDIQFHSTFIDSHGNPSKGLQIIFQTNPTRERNSF